MCSMHIVTADRPTAAEQDRAQLQELEREICELAAHINAASCRWLLLVAEFDRRRGWAEWGVKSCAHWLSWRCSIGLGTAREQVRVARRLCELPLVREAFAGGELSFCKVRAITRVARPEIEASMVEIARHATGAQLEMLVRGYAGALAATVETAQRAHERRGLQCCWDDDGSLVLRGRVPAEEGALLLRALDALDEPRDESDTRDVRRADGLIALARQSLLGAENEQRGDPIEMVVHVDVESLAGEELKSMGEIAEGPALAPETLRRLGCDASVVRILERDGKPLSVSRRKRTIPAALRRALRRRDHGCQFPGCTHRRFLHAHHIYHWARGGPTTLDNLVQLCSYHHRLVHEGGFRAERAGPGSVRFRRRDGRVVAAAGPCRPAAGASIEAQHQACGLGIDDRTCKPRSAGDPLDYGIAVEAWLARVQHE